MLLNAGQHTLTQSDGSNKHCIQVKLTDSCNKAIEEYLKYKVLLKFD